MNTTGAGSVAAQGPKKRWSRFREVAALVVVVLYFVAVARLAVSKDWDDLTASRLFGLTGAVAALLLLASLALRTAAVDDPRKRWTKRRVIATLVMSTLLLAGVITSIIRTGTPWDDPAGLLLLQTAQIATTVFLILDEPARDRP